jgi:hypothetical protein
MNGYEVRGHAVRIPKPRGFGRLTGRTAMNKHEARRGAAAENLPRAPSLRAFTAFMIAALVANAEVAGAELPLVKPEGGPMSADEGFVFATKPQKTRRAVSGVACPELQSSSRPRFCLVVFDEGVEARYATIGTNSYVPDPDRVVLRASAGELDAEGAATDGRYFYVTGSHSPKRGTCENNPDSRHVLRLPMDAKTGRALRARNESLVRKRDSGDLWTIMASLPAFKGHVGDRKCLGTEPPDDAPNLKGQRGANIEGLAVKNGRLFFGFRGPAQYGETIILSVDAKAFFARRHAKPVVTRIMVGERRGIRDLEAVPEGILILAGPDDDASSEGVGWIIGLWDGKYAAENVVEPKWFARLDLDGVKKRECDKELKPEALTLLEKPTDHYRVLILSDGMCDGGPLTFKIPR